jgi:hypothetical protein
MKDRLTVGKQSDQIQVTTRRNTMVSIEVKFNEAIEALDKVGKRAKFEEKRKAGSPVEVQLNLAETILKESRVIRKHNGAVDNGHETFTESTHSISEGYVQEADGKNMFAAGDAVIMESLGLSAEQQRVLTGKQPAEYANLTEAQKRDFDFARACGISEADAVKLTKLTPISR